MSATTRASYAAIIGLAQAHGWTHAEHQQDKAHTRAEFWRDSEHVNLTVWHKTDGIPSAYANLAAGRVATTYKRLHWSGHPHRYDDVAELFTGKRASDYPASPWVAVVDSGQYIDSNAYATASNYNVLDLTPGRYPVELVGGDFVARVPAIVVREHYVDRLFTAFRVHDKPVHRSTVAVIRDYAYNVGNCGSYLGGHARILPAV
ncbi:MULTISPECIES: hypothetical protein [Nocardia]|uniref:hypothetical protein n=1 Tax=Nocardia TaxID=1817 RepID=UPI002455591D|nr:MULTISPECIES: hypothetical protein [Nocardia]